MSDTTFFILSLSIGFPAILGIIRFRKMDPAYHPFIYYTCLSLLVEVVVYILLSDKRKDLVGTVYNLFALTEFCLLTRMFYNWGLFKRRKNTFTYIIAFSFLLFIGTLYIRGYDKTNYFAQIVNHFALIFFSISAFNRMILNEKNNIFKNAKFWICISIIIYYTYFILMNTEQLSFLNIKRTDAFENKIFQINAYTNVLASLLYTVAVIWIPKNKNIITLL
ncbi:MAG TPA: hypothetical protein VKI61_06200 [Chitinophagaceae bacterium]|jgi:hypothetical protein|nr:hypothetical protein [Chitinophagaceae bacterium]